MILSCRVIALVMMVLCVTVDAEREFLFFSIFKQLFSCHMQITSSFIIHQSVTSKRDSRMSFWTLKKAEGYVSWQIVERFRDWRISKFTNYHLHKVTSLSVFSYLSNKHCRNEPEHSAKIAAYCWRRARRWNQFGYSQFQQTERVLSDGQRIETDVSTRSRSSRYFVCHPPSRTFSFSRLRFPLTKNHEHLHSSRSRKKVSCTNRISGRRRSIPVIIRISDINDNAPVFLNSSYSVTIPEVSYQSLSVFIFNVLAACIDFDLKGFFIRNLNGRGG